MTPRIAFIAALWCCALLMQSLGLLHGYVHPHASAHRAPVELTSAAPDVHVARLAAPADVSLPGLFSGHDGGSVACALFDQLTHADLLHTLPAGAVAHQAPSHPDAVHAAWHHATQATGFLARAPPALG